VVAPTPTFPLERIEKRETPVEVATLKSGLVSPAVPTRETSDEVEVVPIESAESHPDPIKIAVSVADPPVIVPMLRPIVVPVAAPDPTNGIVIPLKIPPAWYVVGDCTLIIDWVIPAKVPRVGTRRSPFQIPPDVVPGVMSIREADDSIAAAPPK
jgi:hypothetical protein